MNIQNKTQFSAKSTGTAKQLLSQFPVSSGTLHRKHEKTEPYSNFVESTAPYQTVPSGSVDKQNQAISPKLATSQYQTQTQCSQSIPVTPTKSMQQQPVEQSIFSAPETLDVNSVINKRWVAVKKLYKNLNSVQALNEMYEAQANMQMMLESKNPSGQFTGSTGAKVLTPDELSSGYQAWAHQDQLLTAQPVTGGMGMFLLKKMGWKPGEGLGKYKKGNTEPISFRVKLDKRGLASNEDIIDSMTKLAQPSKSSEPIVKTLGDKHPVSLLGEYCSKRRIGAPRYEEFSENGPNNKKKYLFKVVVNGVTYKPTVANLNKKMAKIEAAQLCLQSIGVLP